MADLGMGGKSFQLAVEEVIERLNFYPIEECERRKGTISIRLISIT